MLLPCRFCTRMSLICPINSSRSNQSSQPRPAIWSRAESRLDPGSIAHKAPPGGGRRGGGGGCCSGREPSIVQPGGLEPRRAGHAQADINGRDHLHQWTWLRLTAASSGAERATTRGGEECRAEERRGRAESSCSTWLVFPRWEESRELTRPPFPTYPH